MFLLDLIPFLQKNVEERTAIEAKTKEIKTALEEKGIRVMLDMDDSKRPGFKFAEYELKGIPVRIVIGPRDLANGVVEVARRDTKEKSLVQLEGLEQTITQLLDDITKVDTWDEFISVLDGKAGFILAHWDGTSETETKIKELTKATIRCIPLDNPLEDGKCILTGKPSIQRVLFARAY